MIAVNLYENPYGEEFRTLHAEEGQTLREIFGEEFDYCNALITRNGEEVDGSAIVREGDVVCARVFPALITAAVAGITWLVTGGQVNLFDNIREGLAKWLFPDMDEPTNAASSETEGIPSIKGCKNKSIKGHPVPIILGKTLATPYYCGNPYTSISGDDGETQTYTVRFCVGYGDLDVRHIKLGELVLSENSNGISEGPIPVSKEEGSAGRFVGAVELEIGTGERSEMYPRKVVQENLNFQLLCPEGTTPLKAERFSATYPHEIEVELSLNSLIGHNDSGEEVNAKCSVLLGISLDGGRSYTPFGPVDGWTHVEKEITNSAGEVIGTATESTLVRKKNKAMRFVARRTLTYEEAMYLHEHGNDVAQIFLQKSNTDSTSGKVQDKVFCSGIRTFVYDYEKSVADGAIVPQALVDERIDDRVVCLTMRVTASNGFSDLNGTLNELSVVAESKCRTWNGSSWSEEKVPSSNPASVALELLQSKSLGKFSVPDSKIKLDKFGMLYEFCESHKGRRHGTEEVVPMPLRIEGELSSQKKLIDAVNLVLSTGRASFIIEGNMYSVLIDCPREYPVAILNNHSFLKGGVTNSKKFEDLPDGYKVKFVNERIGYAVDSLYVMVGEKTSADPSAVIEEIETTWVTNPDLVWQSAVYGHAKRKLRPETWNRKVGIEGNLVEVGSMVEIQDDTILVGIGDGGEIRKVLTNDDGSMILGVVTDSEFGVFDLSKKYGAKIMVADGVNDPYVIVREVAIDEEGYTNVLMFREPVSSLSQRIPAEGDTLSFGVYGKITYEALCANKKDNGDGTFDFTFVPYDERVYDADLKGIPEFNSKITDPKVMTEVEDVPEDYVKRGDYNAGMAGLVSGKTDVGNPSAVSSLRAYAVKDGIDVSWTKADSVGLANTIQYYLVEISRDGGKSFEVSGKTSGLSYLHPFDRNTDGYPEADGLVGWKFRVSAVSVYGLSSETVEAPVDSSGYGTWKLAAPSVEVKCAERSVTVVSTMRPRADGKSYYGDVNYEYLVRRPDTDGQEDWYTPATSQDPYGSEDAYREEDKTEPLVRGGYYTQIMPLLGQETNDIRDTAYQFKVRAVNEASRSEPVTVTAVALCTNIRDIVHARQTDKEIYVPDLSAISANLGEISQGSMAGSNNNYWTLSDKRGARPSTEGGGANNSDFQGAFRVGGDRQYFLVKPVLGRDGRTVINYEISLMAENISLTNSGLDFTAGTYVYGVDPNIRLKLSMNGITVQRKLNSADEWGESNASDVGTVSVITITDDGGNVYASSVFTNDPKSVHFGNYSDGISSAYHFSGTVLDEKGLDLKGLSLSAENLKDGGFLVETAGGYGLYDGRIRFTHRGQTVVLSKSDGIRIGDWKLNADGTKEEMPSAVVKRMNDSYALFGLTEEQAATKIFRLEE